MPGFQETMQKLRELILSFAGKNINIIVCHLDFDSLVAAFALRYYVKCLLGVDKKVMIFCNENLQDIFLQTICRHFSFFSHHIKNALDFDGNGGHIFIDYTGDSEIFFPNIKKGVILGNVDRGVVSEHNPGVIKFSSKLTSASSIAFNLLSVSGFLKSKSKELNELVFLLILAIHHDKQKNKHCSSHNLLCIGRAVEFLGMITFHDMLEKLPDSILQEIKSDDSKF